MLPRDVLACLAHELGGDLDAGLLLCAFCGMPQEDGEVCEFSSECSNGAVVYDPATDTFIPPLSDDPIDRLVVERFRPAHGLGGGVVVLDELVDEAPAAPRRKRRAFVAERPETSIQEGCKALVLELGGYAVVTTGSKYMVNGTPDLLGSLRGRSLAIEIKKPTEVPRADQMGQLRRWQTAGALVGWACSEREMRALLDHIDDRGWHNPLTGPGDGSTT